MNAKNASIKFLHREWFFLVVMLLVAILSLGMLFPRRVTPASATVDVFSAERALVHLPIIAREIHSSGSPAQAQVRDYLVQQLTSLGLETEVQQTWGVENVVGRLYGSNPTGAILLLAHYDSINGPGAADNGSGVAALLEVIRALQAGPSLQNDIIVLFDDSEELPDPFTGTKAFISRHRWMEDVRVAVGMDTAVRGFICTDDTGQDNGWMVDVLARAYVSGPWSSLCGGGTYDTKPFRDAGIRVLELEDNYPFHEQHTADDIPEIVNPGSVQQLGEQVLAVTREMGDLDLGDTSGTQETYLYVPLIGMFHYPEAWALPLAVGMCILLLVAFGLALWNKVASWRGLGLAALVTLVTAGVVGMFTNLVWKAAPDLLDWQTWHWSEWPEVIPPHGWLILVLTNLVGLVLMVLVYRLVRRWVGRVNFSLFSLLIFGLVAVALAAGIPRAAIYPTWPVLIAAVGWIVGLVLHRRGKLWGLDLGALIAAIPTILYILPLVPGVFMGDGTKSVAITGGVFVIILGVVLPIVDGLLRRNPT